MPKTHFSRMTTRGDITRTGTICNRMTQHGDIECTTIAAEVTCKICQRELTSRKKPADPDEGDAGIATPNTMPIVIFRDGGDTEETIHVPCRFIICRACEGKGTDGGASVEPVDIRGNRAGFTSSEWADQDDDFRRDYLAGRYDRPCPHCRETPGRTRVPDLKALSAADRAAYKAQLRDDADFRRLQRMEREMGA